MSIHYCDVCGGRNEPHAARPCPYCAGLVLCDLNHLASHLAAAHPVQSDAKAPMADSWDPSDIYQKMRERAVKAPEPGLSATESGERGEVDPAVELVARTLCAARTSIVSDWNDPPVPAGIAEQWRDRFRDEARAVLVALRRDGSALPPVVQTREEWGRWCVKCNDFDLHRDQRNSLHTHVRTITTFADDGSPYGGATLTSAWRAVEGNEG